MPEPIEPNQRAVPDNSRFHQDMRMALRAHAQYCATLKILLALEEERHAEEKNAISYEQTIGAGNSAS